jgi:DNA-binding FadR family transcriptional regulator
MVRPIWSDHADAGAGQTNDSLAPDGSPESVSSLPESVDRVASELREDILRLRYRPGDRLPSERELAERLQVSRGAVREALRALAELGILEIGPGGARAVGVEDASFEVIGHLLALEELPEPELVAQVMEAHGVLAGAWMRTVIERDDAAEIDELRQGLRTLSQNPQGTPALHELAQALMERSPNLVLRLMRKGLQLHFLQRLIDAGVDINPPHELLEPLAAKLDAALAARDGGAAAELVHCLMKLNRERALKALESERERESTSKMPRALAHGDGARTLDQRPMEEK